MPLGRRTLPQKIAQAVIANMRESLTPLVYTTVAPASYVVYLHKADYATVEGIVPALAAQIDRALDEAIARLERRRWWTRLLDPARDRLPPVERPAARTIEIVPDPNGELAQSQIGVHSQLRLPVHDYAGPPTVRVTATTTGGGAATHCQVPLSPAIATGAVLVVEDLDGRREHPLVDNPTLVGRGGLGCYVHVRVRTGGVVSKEHCRLRRDERSGEYLVKDLSRNGTFLNGTRLPRGVEYSGTQKTEVEGCEVPIADGARIGLADALALEFRRIQT